MRYGNTFRTIRPALLVALLLGTATSLCILITRFVYGTAPQEGRWLTPVFLFAGMPVCMFVMLAPTLLFSIRIEDGLVKHVFLNRHILSQYPAADFQEMRHGRGKGWPSIRFSQNRVIRFYGAHADVLRQLEDALKDASLPHPRTNAPSSAEN